MIPIDAVRWAIRSSKVVSGERTLLKRLCRLATSFAGTCIGAAGQFLQTLLLRLRRRGRVTRSRGRTADGRSPQSQLYLQPMSYSASVHALLLDTTAVWGFVT